MRDLLEFIVGQLVESPRAVRIEESRGDNETRFLVTVAQEDRGRVIGKRGRTAEAIRVVMNSAASRTGQRVNVEFID